MKSLWSIIRNKLPKFDGFSLSWSPSLNFSLPKTEQSNNLQRFEKMMEKSRWRREFINHKEVWINDDDNTLQIERGDYCGEFREPWLEIYPDPVGARYPVYLKINNTPIKELTFIACDGGRIFVPLPERDFENDHAKYKWRRDSLPFKVCKIIGEYYIYNNIEGIARVSKINII